MKNLIREVHRRSLWQVLGIYLAGSWVALQVVEQLAEAASLPPWVRPAALALLVIGFPIVMATAFVQEGLSPKVGTDAETPAAAPTAVGAPPSAEEAVPSTAATVLTWRNAIAGGVAAFALWGVAVTIMMLTGTGPAGGALSSERSGDRIAIAVLPFANLGDDDQSRVFSLGIHDDLLTRLSKIGSLRVTSRTSVMQYAEEAKSIPEIADELGVDYVLEGSVLGSGGRVNINAQLIDGDSDDHLWAETYNRALSVSGVFTIQKELAQKITESLSATLLPQEVAAIEAPPTENLEAYNSFLRGHTFFQSGPRSSDFDAAIEMYERAVELDPEFAEAWARLSYALGLRYEVQRFGDPEVPARALAAAERAFELDPDLPEAALAFGQYYYVERNLNLAMENLTRAGQGDLHSADVFHLLGATQRRQGDLAGSIASWEEMVRIDPLSAHYHDDLGSSLAFAARWDESNDAYRRQAELDPRVAAPYVNIAENYLSRGDLDGAEASLASIPEGLDGGGFAGFIRWQLAIFRRDYESALELSRNPWWRAQTYDYAGDPRLAAVLDTLLPRMEEALAEAPDAPGVHDDLAWIYGALGRRDEAIGAADRAMQLQPVATDFIEGTDYVWGKALVHARFGETGAALDALESLIERQPPGDYTVAWLELEPGLDSVREDPRFAAIVEAQRKAEAGG
jgi:TolB-like protein/Flp pilus assembly protein TadD